MCSVRYDEVPPGSREQGHLLRMGHALLLHGRQEENGLLHYQELHHGVTLRSDTSSLKASEQGWSARQTSNWCSWAAAGDLLVLSQPREATLLRLQLCMPKVNDFEPVRGRLRLSSLLMCFIFIEMAIAVIASRSPVQGTSTL